MDLVFLGPPGAGKGTQAQRLAEALRIPHISTGAILRRAVADGTPTGKKAKALMDAGRLVPDDVLAALVKEALARPDAKDGSLFDGYPRNEVQAETLDRLLGELGRKVDAAVLVDAPEEVLIARLSGRRSCPRDGMVYHVDADPPRTEGRCDRCGTNLVLRDDDRPETVRDRLDVYRKQTAGIEARYEKAGILLRVDGAGGSPHEVYGRVRAAVEERRA